MQSKILSMLKMQHKMNSVVHPDWINQNFPWHRAIMAEAGEIYSHDGSWKWWKKQTPNLEQLHLELVDIWHFGMSMLLVQQKAPLEDPLLWQTLSDVVTSGYNDALQSMQEHPSVRVLDELEAFVAGLLTTKRFHPMPFFRLCEAAGLSFDSLYRQYVAKNVLNIFRQDHGYKTGEYVKIWNGEEDNVHLVRIMDEVFAADVVVGDPADLIYDGLQAVYNTVTNVKK